MSILFLSGLESGPTGSKARYLQQKYPSQMCIPDLRMSLWRPDRRNSVVRRLFWKACAHPLRCLTNWNEALKEAALDSLEKCVDVAAKEICRVVDHPLRLVIGSSWGGAIALCLLGRGDWKGPTLLIAPALKLILRHRSNNIDTVRRQVDTWYQSILAHLPEISQRTKIIVIHGDRDDTVPLEDSQELCEVIGAKLVVVSGGDHRLNDYLLEQNQLQAWIDRMVPT